MTLIPNQKDILFILKIFCKRLDLYIILILHLYHTNAETQMKTLKQIMFAFSMFSCFISLTHEVKRFVILFAVALNVAVIAYSFLA